MTFGLEHIYKISVISTCIYLSKGFILHKMEYLLSLIIPQWNDFNKIKGRFINKQNDLLYNLYSLIQKCIVLILILDNPENSILFEFSYELQDIFSMYVGSFPYLHKSLVNKYIIMHHFGTFFALMVCFLLGTDNKHVLEVLFCFMITAISIKLFEFLSDIYKDYSTYIQTISVIVFIYYRLRAHIAFYEVLTQYDLHYYEIVIMFTAAIFFNFYNVKWTLSMIKKII